MYINTDQIRKGKQSSEINLVNIVLGMVSHSSSSTNKMYKLYITNRCCFLYIVWKACRIKNVVPIPSNADAE